MGRALTLVWLSCVMGLAGCSGDSNANCPPEYPVEMGGFCYRADGGAMMPVDASMGDGGGGDVDSGGGDVDAAAMCSSTHPLVEGERRYCEMGDCYCGTPDACFSNAVAASCCEVGVVCTDTDGGAPPDTDAGPPSDTDAGGAVCSGTHPIVEGDRRFCESGDCYCGAPDNCFPAEIAASCCEVDVVCE